MLLSPSAIIINSFLAFFCFLAEATPSPQSIQPPAVVRRQELQLDPADIWISSVSAVGTGPGGCTGVEVAFAPVTFKIHINYGSFSAWTGDTPPNDLTSASSCHITWVINHPADLAVGLDFGSTVSGNVNLPVLSNHTAYLSDDLQFGTSAGLNYYTSWQGPLESTEFTYWTFPLTPVDLSGCSTNRTQTEFRLSTYLEVERQPITGRISLDSQDLALEWDPCPL